MSALIEWIRIGCLTALVGLGLLLLIVITADCVRWVITKLSGPSYLERRPANEIGGDTQITTRRRRSRARSPT